jgi:hypothetical protein
MSTKRLTAATTIIASFVAVIVFVGPNLQHSAAMTSTRMGGVYDPHVEVDRPLS